MLAHLGVNLTFLYGEKYGFSSLYNPVGVTESIPWLCLESILFSPDEQ
jgi:hypothetical protein